MSKPETETETCDGEIGNDNWWHQSSHGHMADFVTEDKRIVRYGGSRHELSTNTREHVEWEPVDAAREAVRALLRDSKRARDITES